VVEVADTAQVHLAGAEAGVLDLRKHGMAGTEQLIKVLLEDKVFLTQVEQAAAVLAKLEHPRQAEAKAVMDLHQA
jgi:hypothetical protein